MIVIRSKEFSSTSPHVCCGVSADRHSSRRGVLRNGRTTRVTHVILAEGPDAPGGRDDGHDAHEREELVRVRVERELDRLREEYRVKQVALQPYVTATIPGRIRIIICK